MAINIFFSNYRPVSIPTSFPGFSPTRPTEQERERENLENAGHVAPEQN